MIGFASRTLSENVSGGGSHVSGGGLNVSGGSGLGLKLSCNNASGRFGGLSATIIIRTTTIDPSGQYFLLFSGCL